MGKNELSAKETMLNIQEEYLCSEDCDWCGDNICQSNETCGTCIKDCSCQSDKKCEDNKCVYYCGNNQIDLGETCANCPQDIKCSDAENCINSVCETYCGNGICEFNEEEICDDDCNWCGDGVCENSEINDCLSDCGLNNTEALKRVSDKDNSDLLIKNIHETKDSYIIYSKKQIKIFGVIPVKVSQNYKLNKIDNSVKIIKESFWVRLFPN